MRIYLRLTAYFQLVIQVIFLFVNSFIFSFPAHAATNPDTNQKKPTTEITAQSTAKKEEDEAGKNLAAILSSTGSMLSQDNKTDALINSAINNGSAYVTGQIQQWLQQFGTAKVNLGLDKDLSLNNASLDLLLPLYDDKKQNLLFTQWGEDVMMTVILSTWVWVIVISPTVGCGVLIHFMIDRYLITLMNG
ncbi:inverse autotransporter beta domain-containing protein [Salmonella enterica]|nr:hypothetical protein [Salmonella enterica]EIO3759122.1 inverse autotransporter beta domain-containing protein [Salmonella enterica]SUG17892.1 intimin/invasin [Salmonella enterica subsp. arizonae]